MSKTPLPIQNNPTESPTSGTDDCDVPTPHGYTSPLVDLSPPGGCPTYYPSLNVLLLTSDETTETGEPGVRQGGDQIYSPRPLDTFPTPGLPAFLNSYPQDATSSPELFNRAEEASSSGYKKQYHLGSPLEASNFGYPDARDATLPTRVAAAATVYASQDEISRLFSTKAHRSPSFPPQGNLSFHLESSTRALPGTATSSTVYMDGASGHPDDRNMGHQHPTSPPFQPVAGPGYGGNVTFDTPVPHLIPDPVIQGMRLMRLNSRPSISPHPEFASRHPFIFSPPAGSAEPRYTSPEIIDANRQDHQSSVPASAYAGNDYPTQCHDFLENGMQSWGEQMSTQTHGEALSGHSHRSTLPPYSNTGDQSGGLTATSPHYDSSRMVMFDQLPDPRLSLHVYVPPYALYGQAAAGEGNITARSFASSDERYNYALRQTAIWGGRTQPSTAAITTRAHRGSPSWQYHHRAPSSSMSTVYPSDVAVNALARNMRPIRYRNTRQSNARFIPPHRELSAALQFTPSTSDVGHFVASSSALADEDRTDCSPPPATCLPTTGFNAQNLLRRVLGPTPRLKNEALVTLIVLILRAPFYRMDEMEPTCDSEDGMALLRQIQPVPGCPPGAFDASSDSLFTLFASHSKFRCLVCGSSKQAMVRAIGCFRSHLNHRPFPCLGENGCKSCPKGQIVKRFFTASLLHDHCSKQERAIDCTYCGKTYTSNIKRHWESKHKHTPFKYEDYPNYVPE